MTIDNRLDPEMADYANWAAAQILQLRKALNTARDFIEHSVFNAATNESFDNALKEIDTALSNRSQTTAAPTKDRRKEIMRLMREDFDPTPAGWEGRDWDDNAEDVADHIEALFVLSEKPTQVSDRQVEAENEALKTRVDWFEGELAKADEWKAHNRVFEAKVAALQLRVEELTGVLRMPDAYRRLWFISDRIGRDGFFNRSDICREFSISVPQASADIKRWMEKHPGAISYNKSAKRYEHTLRTALNGGEWRPEEPQ